MQSSLSRNSIYIYCTLLLVSFSIVNADDAITITINRTITPLDKELYGDFITIKQNSTLQVNLENIPKDVAFVIFQVHSHNYNITLYNNTLVHGSYISGSNVGLYSSAKALDTFFIRNTNDLDLKLYISVLGYYNTDPIPGGCNMEFAVNISVFMSVKYTSDYILSDVGFPKDSGGNCDKNTRTYVKFYRLYLPENRFDEDTYFNGIISMMTKEKIEQNGDEIPRSSLLRSSEVRRILAAYPGTGSIYAAIAYSTVNDSIYSVYVPSYTYACSPVDGNCEGLDDITSEFFCAVLLFVGLFTCYFGHRFFKTEMFLVGFFAGVIITYILISKMTNLDRPALLGASVISGLFFGSIWSLYWWFYGIPVIAVLLPTLHFGFISSAITYYRLPGGHYLLEDDISFWTFFLSLMILTSLILVTTTYLSNIMCCAFLGAYATVFSIDHYIGSNLRYIFINAVRRATVSEFRYAVVSPPYLWKEIISTALWSSLALSGLSFQRRYNRGRPPFPPPPRSVRPSMPPAYGAIDGISRPRRDVEAPLPAAPDTIVNARTPLLYT